MTRYVVQQEEVGTGGFGKVRKGRDTELDRDIAVKTLDPLWAVADDRDKERFRREARVLAKLSHPNIPAIYDVVFSESEFHIVFQYIEGKTLRDLLAQGCLTPSEAHSWFDQVASALEHAHSKNIIHRDIKPENMIVTSDRKHCYLVDFGIALSEADLSRLTDSDERLGTPGYMSPEQEKGEELDPSSDVYVLGANLYEALSGHSIKRGEYVALNIQNEAIPPAIDELIQGCIAEKPQRISSAAVFRQRLKAALQSHKPLSSVLTSGQLYDVIAALKGMQSQDFLQLPAGQKMLIFSKCRDLALDKNEKLNVARSEFLTALTTLAVHCAGANYQEIVVGPALRFGFDEQMDLRWTGDRRIREALRIAASQLDKPNHHSTVETFLDWIKGVEIEGKQNWYYHELRLFVGRLMANPACTDDDAQLLCDMLNNVNDLQRARSSANSAETEESDVDVLGSGADGPAQWMHASRNG